jgi:hypothetical protein|tara:strand:- start:2456 stop:2596 length:141 start_codon:yes stop_codon:yes gene_type:complete
MIIYINWLVCICAWNFGVPNATPVQDVIVAIILSVLSMALKKYFKF